MTCQACGTEDVSYAATQACSALDRLPEPALERLRSNFDGHVPVELCAECFLLHYDNAIKVLATPGAS